MAHAATERSGGPLRVSLFGGVDLRWRDGDPIPVESGRMRSLLGFLVLNAGVVQPRQHLAFLLWPDSTESQARTNLRKLLHILRRAVPDLERHLAVTPSRHRPSRYRSGAAHLRAFCSGRSRGVRRAP